MKKTIDDFIYGSYFAQLPLSNTEAILTSKRVSNVGLDWLQVCFKGVLKSTSYFTLKKLDFETKVFKSVYNIYYENILIATACNEPKSCIIDEATVIIKLENEILYNYNSIALLKYLAKSMNLVFNNITRIDLCADFQLFKYNLKPAALIKKYLNGDYILKGKSQFKVIGTNGKDLNFEYLRIGTGNSDASIYLYNKSKELKNVKMKPYIVEKWRQLGLLNDNDTWRLEVSLKSSLLNIVEKSTGEVSRLTLDYIESLENLINLYDCYKVKLFTFYHEGSQVVKSRLKKVELFDDYICPIVVKKINNSKASKRSEKIIINHIENYNNDLRGQHILNDLQRREFLEDFIHIHGLEEYYAKKFPDSLKIVS